MKNIIVLFFFATISIGYAQDDTTAYETVFYKKIDTTQLKMRVFLPPQRDSSQRYPAMVFF